MHNQTVSNPTRHLFRIGDQLTAFFWVQKDNQNRRYTGTVTEVRPDNNGHAAQLVLDLGDARPPRDRYKSVVLAQVLEWRMHHAAADV